MTTGAGPTTDTGVPTTTGDNTSTGDTSTGVATAETASTTTEAMTGPGDTGSATTMTDPGPCGNGQIEPLEECDHGVNNGADQPCTADCRINGRLIFTTAAIFTGGMGYDDANKYCHVEGAAYFRPDRNFRAWLSVMGDPMINHLGPTGVAYRLPGTERVALNNEDLLDGSLEHALDQDVAGKTIPGDPGCTPGSLAWTGTDIDGTTNPAECVAWSGDGMDAGAAGNITAQDASWTFQCPEYCDELLRLYCIDVGL